MSNKSTQALELIRKCKENQEEFLDLGSLGLKELPAELFELTHLKGLNLGGRYYASGKWENSKNTGNANRIKDVNLLIAHLSNLEELTLGGNPLSSLHFIGSLPHLKVLDLSNTTRADLDSILDILAHLKVLRVSAIGLLNLNWLPKQLYHDLEVLDLSQNKLDDLSALQIFPNLQVLNATINHLRDSSNFPDLPKLKELYLGGNFFSEADGLNNLINLEIISLGFLKFDQYSFFNYAQRHNSNFLLDWPNWPSLSKLRSIDLMGNFISTIPALNRHPNLEALYLGRNQIKTLGGISNLLSLKTLSLGNLIDSHNAIREAHIPQGRYSSLKNTFSTLDQLGNNFNLEALFLDNLTLYLTE